MFDVNLPVKTLLANMKNRNISYSDYLLPREKCSNFTIEAKELWDKLSNDKKAIMLQTDDLRKLFSKSLSCKIPKIPCKNPSNI